MSLSVQNQSSIDVKKWALAECYLKNNTNAPEKFLKLVFDDIINRQLEQDEKTKLMPLKDTIWKLLSRERLASLHDTLIENYCNQVLPNFKEEEVETMLNDFKQNGGFTNPKYSIQLHLANYANREQIIDAVRLSAFSMYDKLYEDLTDLLEGRIIVNVSHFD